MRGSIVRAVRGLLLALGVAACGDGTGPPAPPSLTLVPDRQSIQVGEDLQLTATYHDPGSPGGSAPSVSWKSLSPEIATVTSAGVVRGVRAGEARVVAAAGTAADTSRIEVKRTPASVDIEPVGPLAPGEVVQLQPLVRDTEGQPISVAVEWAVSNTALATIDSEGRLTAHAVGMVAVTAAAPPASGSIEIEIHVPPPPEGCAGPPLALAVGEVRRYEGGAAFALCLQGGAEYTLVAANPTSGVFTTRFTAEGVSAPVGPPDPALSAASGIGSRQVSPLPVHPAFERDLRERERRQLAPRGARAGTSVRARQTPANPVVGDLLELSTATDCDLPDVRTGRVQHVGQRAIVVADTANPADLTPADYARFGMLYDTLLHPVVTSFFGEPAGLNGETRVLIFYTRAVNELTPRDSEGVVGGFFWSGDLFPKTACAGSNEREMFYMLAPDPQGVINGNVRTLDFVQRTTAGTIAHELQHLINTSRRVYLNDADSWEVSWLNEGLSHIAEEVVFYHRIGLGPRQNLTPAEIGNTQPRADITSQYAVNNLLRMERYTSEVERQGPFQDDSDLATRGASWQFLRYAIDRHGGDQGVLLRALVDSRTAGLPNLQAVFGVDPRLWFIDNVVTLYTDDAVPGVPATLQHPSWNFRAVLDWVSGGYDLQTRELSSTTARVVTLRAWGAAYLRAGVIPGRIASIRVGSATELPDPALRFVLVRTR